MRIDTRQQEIQELFEHCLEILESKGADYSGHEDGLANFKENAKHLGLTKYQVWLVYFSKHFDSVRNAVKRNPENPQVESEPLSERFKDLINYAALGHCLMLEDEVDQALDYGFDGFLDDLGLEVEEALAEAGHQSGRPTIAASSSLSSAQQGCKDCGDD